MSRIQGNLVHRKILGLFNFKIKKNFINVSILNSTCIYLLCLKSSMAIDFIFTFHLQATFLNIYEGTIIVN